MRVVIVAEDDSSVHFLEPLAARDCQVFGIARNMKCTKFARRCMDLGFNFMTMQNSAVSDLAMESFKPELMVCMPVSGLDLPPCILERADAGGPRKLVVRVGRPMDGAPWPEFGPIWLGDTTSPVSFIAAEHEVLHRDVPVGLQETALSLHEKHAEAAAALLSEFVCGSAQGASGPAGPGPGAPDHEGGKAPSRIGLGWDEETVDRYVRAHLLPPRDPAVVEDPSSGETFFIENLDQWREFRVKVLQRGAGAEPGCGPAYAADTHWYSNVGGSIVKMGDSRLHMPVRTHERKRQAVVPGAALCARKKLRMNEPLIGPNAELYCTNALDSGWIGVEGPYVKQLERHLARICGCSAACAVQSGTAALYGAMKALGVSDPSHHVLVPSFTCAACADAVVHAGGRPVPVDCELDSYGVSAAAVRRCLELDKDVVGVVVAPCYGVPARDSNEIMAICKDRGLWVCEDACESYGALKSIDGSKKAPIGALATLSVVSIRSEKMVGVGEGGAILGNDTTLVARAKWWCSRAPCRGAGLWRVYEHDAVGQNFRLPEMLAAVGCAAAEMLPTMIERKRAIHQWYKETFTVHDVLLDVKLQQEAPGDESVWWITAALLPEGLSGEEVGMRLMKVYPDIEIRPGFFPLNAMKIFRSKLSHPCPNAEMLYKRLVCLPSSNQLNKLDIERICGALAEAVAVVSGSSRTT
eukprot:CAMPEP_0168363024 /NCGR_PEP_ID=MMETSP0228-20121227/3480_1 /TAXON_ID=133427 /ORGANISM="Protoceratium reticulatum, Strain CCCM 535 (=CCMP 1889)" /LENGTH=695 /DNA_ID=CAMNT_0008375743 /DNA_START=47 /DNA_END=2134 /DNA_ORIENTATION=+